MTREQLLAIAKRHEEDHKFDPIYGHDHPRPLTWHKDAVGDRGVLLEYVAELMQGTSPFILITEGSSLGKTALIDLRPPLQTPRLPRLHARKVKKP